ncbi:helix-turn-helix domain-containing protein [Microbacterium sp. CPCC 204701]|uniref:helix-turn-helix domain-containing protein n=1 Tax=Microbacterium sp. CPCC 204701 TaxID=2493084 RepID=UPI0013E40558|nr:helix-turn-helix domain-containing protein [Microbacterium sp. CPCC 204701]
MTVLVTSGTVFVEEGLREQASGLVQRASGIRSPQFRLAADDGAGVEVSAELSAFLFQVLRGLSRGGVAVTPLPEELTTSVAAELVGVSRPTLMKLVRSGVLPSRPVGSHTRLRTSDVLALRRARAHDRREALEALQELEQEFGADS